MKLKLFYVAMALSSNFTFTGNGGSTMPKPKIQIASAEVLRGRVEGSSASQELLSDMKFVEIFADKEMTLDELDMGFTTISNNLWDFVKAEAQKQVGTVAYHAMLPVLTLRFNQQFSEVKPALLALLLLDDYPDLYAKLVGVKK